jgi:lysozyme
MSAPRLSRAVLALVAAGAGSTAIAAAFLAEKEGLALAAYQDGAKVWTICKGHTATARPGMVATPEHCERLFASDLGQAFREIDRLVTVPMSEPRRAAIASFCGYNLGLAKCAKSTLIRRLNAGDAGACDEIPRWVYVGGKDCRDPANKCRGIVTRRQEEAALCRL